MPYTFAEANQNGKCISITDDDTLFSRACSADKKQGFVSPEAKQLCREIHDKCSSSQTGQGSEPNDLNK